MLEAWDAFLRPTPRDPLAGAGGAAGAVGVGGVGVGGIAGGGGNGFAPVAGPLGAAAFGLDASSAAMTMRRRSLDGAALRMLSFGGLAGRPLGSSPPAAHGGGGGGGATSLDDGSLPSQQQQQRRQQVQQHAAAASAAAAAGQQPPAFGGGAQQGYLAGGDGGGVASGSGGDSLPLSRRAISLAFPPGAGSHAFDLRRMLRTGYLLPPLPPVKEDDMCE